MGRKNWIQAVALDIISICTLQIIVEAFIQALPMLADVAILAAFHFSIFGIACVELFKGQFYNRCAVPDFSTAKNATTSGGHKFLTVRGFQNAKHP
jgi:hypothetical protein